MSKRNRSKYINDLVRPETKLHKKSEANALKIDVQRAQHIENVDEKHGTKDSYIDKDEVRTEVGQNNAQTEVTVSEVQMEVIVANNVSKRSRYISELAKQLVKQDEKDKDELSVKLGQGNADHVTSLEHTEKTNPTNVEEQTEVGQSGKKEVEREMNEMKWQMKWKGTPRKINLHPMLTVLKIPTVVMTL